MRSAVRLLCLFLLVPALSRANEAALAAAESALRDHLLSAAELQFARLVEENEDTSLKTQALLGLARTRLAAGKALEARSALQTLPVNIPSDLAPRVRLVRAEVALSRDDTVAARGFLSGDAPEAEPWTTLHSRLMTRLLLAEGKNKEAETFLQKRLDLAPESSALRLEMALLLDGQQRAPEAEIHWIALATGNERLYETQLARIRLAEADLDREEVSSAMQRIQTLIDSGGIMDVVEARAYSVLVSALEKKGEFAESTRYLLALEKRTTDPSALSGLRLRRAQLLIQAGKLDEGRQMLSREIAAQGDHPLAARAQLRLARALADQTNHTATAQAYETYLSVFSDPEGQREARLGLAALREKQEAWAEAAVLYDKTWHATAPEDPLRPHLLLKRADMLLAQGKSEAARELYLQLAETWPKHELLPQALFQAATARAALDPALDELGRLRVRFPQSPFAERALLQQAVLLNRATRLERALGAYDAYLDRYPQGAYVVDAMTDKGIAAYRIGLFDLALRQFDQVLEQFPTHPRAEQAFCMRAWALFLTNRDEEAVKAGRSFLQKYPKSAFVPDMRFWLGELAFNRGDFENAETEFLQLAGNGAVPAIRSKALYLAGRAALARRAFNDALSRFVQSIEVDPTAPHVPDALFHQGDTLTELNRFDAAIVVFDQLAAQHPGSHLLHAARGRKGDCQYTLGEQDSERFSQALASYRLVEESSAASPVLRLQAAYKVGRTLHALKRPEEARAQYLRVVHGFLNERGRMGADADVWFVRAVTDAAQSFEQEQKWREAIQVYRSLADAKLPQSPEAARRIDQLRREHLILF